MLCFLKAWHINELFNYIFNKIPVLTKYFNFKIPFFIIVTLVKSANSSPQKTFNKCFFLQTLGQVVYCIESFLHTHLNLWVWQSFWSFMVRFGKDIPICIFYLHNFKALVFDKFRALFAGRLDIFCWTLSLNKLKIEESGCYWEVNP